MAWRDRAGNVLLGGFQGAATGAGIGTLGIPGIGTGLGAAIGGGIGILQGLLSDTEMQDLARRYARGEIDPEAQNQIVMELADRYDVMRQEQGADLARRGMLESTMASRLISDTYASERDALAKALAGQVLDRQQMGIDMLAKNAQQQQAGYAAGANVFAQLALKNQYDQSDPLNAESAPYQTPVLAAAPQSPTLPQTPKSATSSSGGGHPLVRGVANVGGRQKTLNNPTRSLWRPSALA